MFTRHAFLATGVATSILLATAALSAATVLVVPLHDASPGSDADTGHGVADLVAGALAERAAVVSSEKLDAVLKEQGLALRGLADAATAAKVGKLLKADYVLTGSVFRRPDKIEFAVQLVDVPSGAVLKGLAADGPPDKLLETSAALAAKCAAALKLELPAIPAAAEVGVERLAEERYFLEALGYYNAGNYDRAIMNCLKVIELNPNHEKARLRLAESFLAAGDAEQAAITLRRTMQVFPTMAPEPRVAALLGRIEPLPIQAVEKTTLSVPLPDGWPADATVDYELSWQDQPARRTTAKAVAGALAIEMPGARVPLDIALTLSTPDRPAAARRIRLWPADPQIRQGETKLIIVDPDDQLTGLLKGLQWKHYKSLAALPAPDCRLVIAPAVTRAITPDRARALDTFVAAGGQLSIIGPCPDGVEIRGISRTLLRWPLAATWTPKPEVPAWTFMPAADFAAPLAHEPEAPVLKGGTPWLVSANGLASLISEARCDKGRLLWIAWPTAWDPADPRCARVLALAVSNITAPAAK